MPIRLVLPDYDQLFEDTTYPVIVNHIPYNSIEEREAFNASILTVYESDILSNTPTCGCGELQNGFNLGRICKACGTEVTYPAEGDVGLRTWIVVPPGIQGFIVPEVWVQLSTLLNPKGYNLMEWITNSKSRPPRQLTKVTAGRIAYLVSIKWERGLNAFIQNFDRFLEILPVLTKKKKLDYVDYLRTVRPLIFPRHLPMPTKAMLILENTTMGAWADKANITGAIEAARTIAFMAAPRVKPLTDSQVEKMIVSVILNLANYYTSTIKNNFCTKKGWFRGQCAKSKSHFTIRGVITSITAPHYYEELHIPWAQGLEMLKIHITSVLIRRGVDYVSATRLIENSGNVYNPLLAGIMQELIDGGEPLERFCALLDVFPKSAISTTFQRNPSLDRLAAQYLPITKVKDDIHDKTISMSVLVLAGPNADFDGDEMNLTLLPDRRIAEAGKMLRPHYGIHDITRLGELRHVIKLPEVTCSILGNFCNS